uniref:Major facilitator superfamily (MFS) profile domain-containing protein n=2 Tax=Photinus pyralis TaxID=7054 RepID=A0A1Y1LS22_PHOPY
MNFVILGAEFVSPDKRVLISVLINIATSVGGMIVGSVAWAVPTWRMLDQILYGSCFIILSYYWFLPESLRWLLTKKRYEHASRILSTIAKTNRTTLSKEHMNQLFHTEPLLENTETYPLRKLLQSPILTKRFVNCCVCWIFCLFSYYGLTINAISLSNNGYVDFILCMFVEIPGNIAAHFLMNRIGKRYCFTLAFFICGISSASFIFIPHDLSVIRLSVYLLGKCAAAINMTAIYSLTSEIFPTSLRSSLLTSCSMFGRFGIVVASQTPLLELYWQPLPLVLFALTAFAGSILTLRFPETLNETLPNTIEQAENIGRRKTSERITQNEQTCTEEIEKLTTKNIPLGRVLVMSTEEH